MLDTRIFLVRVFPSVLEGGVRRHTGGNRFGDELAHPVSVFPLNVAEMLVEDLDDVRESVQFRFGAVTSLARWHRLYLGVLVGQHDPLHRPLLDPVAVHVDGIENVLGEVLLLGSRQL